jgi:predicted nucleic acid-binding Zn ribbon protein
VPGTFIICGEDDYQYCSDACLEIAKKVKDIQSKK